MNIGKHTVVLLLLLTSQIAPAQIAPEGRYLMLNGIDQYMVIPNHPDLNIAPHESFTVTCRVKQDNFKARYSIFSKGSILIFGGRYELSTYSRESAPNLALDVRDSDKVNLGSPFITTIRAGYWMHLAWVYNADDKTSKVYLNGELFATVSDPAIGIGSVGNASDLLIGCAATDASQMTKFEFWPGELDELRIWKRALTQEETLADGRSAQAGRDGLVAAYDFTTIRGDSVTDVSGHELHGRLMGFDVRIMSVELPVGIGEHNERLTGFRVSGNSLFQSITSVTLDLSGMEDIRDISSLKVFYNGSAERLNLQTATLFGSCVPTATVATISGRKDLSSGEHYFWITADISPHAKEGNHLIARLLSLTDGNGYQIHLDKEPVTRTILLAHKLLYSGGDGGAKNYRIPAIITAADGTLITATDKRWNNASDLPGHIDVVIRRSTDNGETWDHPYTLADGGYGTGFGDPVLFLNRNNSNLICLFAAGAGFYDSTDKDPIQIFQSVSTDHGLSWSVPKDITRQVYGSESVNPATRNWQGVFVSSGSATQLNNGRLMAVLVVRETRSSILSNYILYSDDDAITWHTGPSRAYFDGNEAKVAELDDHRILMSIRKSGTRIFRISQDQGYSWGIPFTQSQISTPSCNGDLIRYTSVSEGYNRNRLLHSLPLGTERENISVIMSYDEGQYWSLKKTIYKGPSAYSSLTILNDGTIGLYYEVGEYETYQMYFARFSLEWLSDDNDYWTDKTTQSGYPLSEYATSQPPYTAYPNPTEGTVTIIGAFDKAMWIELYNSQGVLLDKKRVDHPCNKFHLPLEGLNPGMYLLKIGNATVRLIVR